MNDKTPPYVIDFDDIQPGDTIETSRKLRGITSISQAVAAYLADDWEWRTAEDGCITHRGEARTIRLLDRPEPPKPGLRKRVEALAKDFARHPDALYRGDYVTKELSDALAETSADA